ncbi:Undecaprenyl-phosphate galactose phosphotransferase [Halothece sp. PCC 7418]|uniref:sugar transferase n=1 Tax=Halothece sp. (strain PCC 7418) TaxID=65093 RepID=UPI0002A076BE|nr:sugar transferase [Halothece sp. PCC 7418]AFZ44065.1 Undecaprenyl-phosphate galactose phosphotransferase [Halothece sp. PCC 7418]
MIYNKLSYNRLDNRSRLEGLWNKLSVYTLFWAKPRSKTKSQSKNLLPVLPSVESKAKRAIDILGALVGLSLTAIIYMLIAPVIYFDDPGPIFYRQTRIGLHGQSFRIWKFRSMVQDAEKYQHLVPNEAQGHIFKNENDPRVTRIGAILRQTSLDEFPQFLNVLKGEMSLVGTRPPTPDEVSRYLPHHFQRLHVKPGLTGEWQVNGRSTVKDFEEIVKMDLLYQKKWSLGYDFKLIFKTVLVVLTKKGAC